MVTGWRLLRKDFAEAALTGEGARIHGGRWNRRGTSVIYASEHLSLAALELFARLELDDAMELFTAIPIEIPDSVRIDRMAISSLPDDWRETPPVPSTQDIGEDWIKKRATAVLMVPCIIFPLECNLIINPSHSDFSRISVGRQCDFAYDNRA